MSCPQGIDNLVENDYTAILLDERREEHRLTLGDLRADPRIEFLDTLVQQQETLARLRPPVTAELRDEPHRWAYYPWRRTVVAVLGPQSFTALRLDRNRNLITAEEQERLGRLRIGIVGLSVGHVIAHTLALQGVVGRLRLADFDTLEVSNLNRVPATVLDLGVNKAVIAARRIAELNPYLEVEAMTDGLTTETTDKFLDDLDIVVEECDSLDIKVILREAARSRRIPVLMSTSDRGLVDVERFDHEPTRPVLHGMLQGIDSSQLAGLSSRDKILHMLRFLDVSRSSARAAASMVEVNVTLTTWPQLASEVVLGATSVVEAVRRIGLDEPLPSGRARIDVAAALDQLEQPVVRTDSPHDSTPADRTAGPGVANAVASAASHAPSAGNAQPWHITADERFVSVEIDPALTSTLDIGFRASAVAVGAAAFNARVAAASHHALGQVTVHEGGHDTPLRQTIALEPGTDPDLARLYQPMLARQTNRRHGPLSSIDAATVEALAEAARTHGGQLHVLTDRADIDSAAGILGASDRIRYLTPQLHAEMITEVRWADDPEPATSRIDMRDLELDADDAAALDILRRPEVMAHLADWSAGSKLAETSRDRVRASSALGVLTVLGRSLTDFARGGSAAEALWITANDADVAVHPVSPLFLYALDDAELAGLSSNHVEDMRGLQRQLRGLAGLAQDETIVLVLRFTTAAAVTGPRSRRRDLTDLGRALS